jgi:hypothetical protein
MPIREATAVMHAAAGSGEAAVEAREQAMMRALAEARAEGISDPAEQRRRMMAAVKNLPA